MITFNYDPFEIDQLANWEESDLRVANTLSHETEQLLLKMAREIREQLMDTPLHGDELFMKKIALETSFLRGKYELLITLVQNSKEEKVKAHLI